jgi:hypothetical protein
MAEQAADSDRALSVWDASEFSEDALAAFDVAALNLAAAEGLRGETDVAKCLDKLDDWADRVKVETLRHIYRFDPASRRPASEFSYGNSLARFCCYVLLQVLQEDCGVVYNPARKFDPNFGEPADLFIHGILDEKCRGGTCATMPVVYVAVARRLGYPVRLVEAREHLFFRWDDARGVLIEWEHPETRFWIPPDRFNVEGAGEGIAYYPDSHYIQWPRLWKEADFAHGRYLRSMTRKEELASFLVLRGECYWEYRNWSDALQAYFYACKLVPEDRRYGWLHARCARRYEEWCEAERERLLEINERNRRAAEQRAVAQVTIPVTPKVVKIAFGTPIPTDLPPGAVVQYVQPEEADPRLPVGRPLRVAAGRPLPNNLPPGIGIQVVAPEFADPLPPEYDECCAGPNAAFWSTPGMQAHLENMKRVHEQNRRLMMGQNANRTLRHL